MIKTQANGKTFVWSRAFKLWVAGDGDSLTLSEMDKLKWR